MVDMVKMGEYLTSDGDRTASVMLIKENALKYYQVILMERQNTVFKTADTFENAEYIATTWVNYD